MNMMSNFVHLQRTKLDLYLTFLDTVFIQTGTRYEARHPTMISYCSVTSHGTQNLRRY